MHETVLYNFGGGHDGAIPYSGLVGDGSGALYGTTRAGGANGWGIAFRLTPSKGAYAETVLHDFGSGNDGETPVASVVADALDNLYGTTQSGGDSQCGVVYELSPSGTSYSERIIYSFRGGGDGCEPRDRLTLASDGTFYGTTAYGGHFNRGTVFALTPSSDGYVESVLLRVGARDGGKFPFGGVVQDAAGDLFAAAPYGADPSESGTVFELRRSGSGYQYAIVHRFKRRNHEGASPAGGLILGAGGSLFGTTLVGGAFGKGVVYALQPSGDGYSETTLFSFNGADGALPSTSLITDASGALYGTAFFGGSHNGGVAFEVGPSSEGYSETVLHAFGGSGDGANPSAELLAGRDGTLYGTTSYGGTYGAGTVFRLTR